MCSNGETFRYREMPFQIKYKKDLNVIDCSEATELNILNHFARNGYENLYITKKGKLCSVLTLDNFLNGERIEGLNRDFICDSKKIHSAEDVRRFFVEYPYIDRITIVDAGELLCEVDSLIELPLQNGIAKNLITIRYTDIFEKELTEYFKTCGKILLIADGEIYSFLNARFPTIHFECVNGLDGITSELLEKYDVVLDYIYCKSLRRAIGFSPVNLVSVTQLLTRFAISKLQRFCQDKGVRILFYRAPNHGDLTCLNDVEYENCTSRTRLGNLLMNEAYIAKFVSSDEEIKYLKSRDYHASIRIDNGYCLIQDECNEPRLHVHEGVRNSIGEEKKEDIIRVFFFGPCLTYGFLVPDEETISSLVKEYALKDKIRISVKNQAGLHGYNELNSIMTALKTPVRKGDIMVILDALDDLDFSEYPNAKQVYKWFNAEKKKEDIWFMDFTWHCNLNANKLVARHIYNDIKPMLNSMGDKDYVERRTSCIDTGFDPFEYMKITHAACVKYFYMYRRDFFTDLGNTIIGAVIISDYLDSEHAWKIVGQAASKCDKLYILKFNDNNSDIEDGRYLSSRTCIKAFGKPARVFQPGYFFDSSRYLPGKTGVNDCKKEYLFTEEIMARVILREMSVSIRFVNEGLVYVSEMEEIYKNAQISLVRI